ncbi:hypothetical protein [Salinibacterium sp. SWN1162]|uniref:hypothetical protein n=1 Tax=Salinibacterium sp. SWN1162 TaxID=2792053 RepID=UPI0018CE6019|nr:hypothetical protein [Salinibacterium sp. SWN1162]MBH0008871.1 hypothetical protein [Salinibacterium sp. SWN1162]
MADLEIDFAKLTELQSTMATVQTEFGLAEAFSEAVADLCGHDGLAGTVKDFGSQWNLRRAELITELSQIADAVRSVHDTMKELDQSLAETVESYRSPATLRAYRSEPLPTPIPTPAPPLLTASRNGGV